MQEKKKRGRPNKRVASRESGRKINDETVSINLSGSLNKEIYNFIYDQNYLLTKNGIGDNTLHNTTLYLLAKQLGLNTEGLFSTNDAIGGFIIDVPLDLNGKLEAASDILNCTKIESVLITLQQAMSKMKESTPTSAQAQVGKGMVDLSNLISIKKFSESNPSAKMSRNNVYLFLRGNRYDTENSGKVIIDPVIIDGNVFIDKSKYRINDNGDIELISN